jgi:hypothetical protein
MGRYRQLEAPMTKTINKCGNELREMKKFLNELSPRFPSPITEKQNNMFQACYQHAYQIPKKATR